MINNVIVTAYQEKPPVKFLKINDRLFKEWLNVINGERYIWNDDKNKWIKKE